MKIPFCFILIILFASPLSANNLNIPPIWSSPRLFHHNNIVFVPVPLPFCDVQRLVNPLRVEWIGFNNVNIIGKRDNGVPYYCQFQFGICADGMIWSRVGGHQRFFKTRYEVKVWVCYLFGLIDFVVSSEYPAGRITIQREAR